MEETIDVAREDFLWKLHVKETAKWKLHVKAKREAESEAEGGRRKRKWTDQGYGSRYAGKFSEIFRNFRDGPPIQSI